VPAPFSVQTSSLPDGRLQLVGHEDEGVTLGWEVLGVAGHQPEAVGDGEGGLYGVGHLPTPRTAEAPGHVGGVAIEWEGGVQIQKGRPQELGAERVVRHWRKSRCARLRPPPVAVTACPGSGPPSLGNGKSGGLSGLTGL
jgi:hypothetical protein